MSNWGTKLLGFNQTMDMFKRIQTQWDGNAVYIVGSNVEYAIYQEMGTSNMPAQPFLRPAVRDWQRDPDAYISRHTNHDGDFESIDELIRVSALAIERDASERAPADTGNLQGSIRSERVS